MVSLAAGRAPTTALLPLVVVLIALRAVTASHLPLSFDEAYFWLWSRHLAISYFEHPPLIALAIRAGTALLGDTSLGVRLMSLLASVAASWAIWRAAAAVFTDDTSAWTACAFLNLTLMLTSQSMGATPDIFVLTASAFLLWSVAELERTRNAWWWLAAALALGAALLAKYTAFFLALSLGLWLLLTPQGRRWLTTPWPYLAAVLAAS
ncbi:MAG TPA: glycosyltransferase family 39 protein, partial [Rhizomicrobium sp.]|nr:glycosyltransferase family 39 protein [Rhizomicrobium sp.]